MSKATSLILLKTNALNADLTVDILVDQKFIKKNDVNPINSQPKNKTKKLPLITNKIILITKQFINNINLSTLGSYLKYENAYIYTKTAMVKVKNIKLKEITSIYTSKLTQKLRFRTNQRPIFILYI